MADAKRSNYGVWAIFALFAAGIVYSIFFAGSEPNRRDDCYERRAGAFSADLPKGFREQIILDCEMELRKSKGLR